MTVAEAREKLEILTRNLASSEISFNQRQNSEAQMARYYRIIQRARQRAHRSLASPALALLNMTGNTAPDRNHNAALKTAAQRTTIGRYGSDFPNSVKSLPAYSTWTTTHSHWSAELPSGQLCS
jgi:hypothetical protein